MKRWDRWTPHLLSILRIMTGLLFMEHGLMKLFHFPGLPPGVPMPLLPLGVASAVPELIGGGLVAAGLFTRWAAFICSGEMAVGYFLIHAPRSFWPGLNAGEGAVLYCFIFLFLCAAGAGPWSLDARFGGRTAAGAND